MRMTPRSTVGAWLAAVLLLETLALGATGCPKSCECSDKFAVDCSSAGLTNLPRNLSPSLTIFRAPFNKLTSLTKAGVTAMGTPKLVDLFVLNNSIATVGPGALADLADLRWADLSDNKISVLPPDAFPPGLQLLTITGNPLTVPTDRALAPCPSLQSLDISYCGLSGSLPATLVAGNANLTSLHVNDNRLTSFGADVIGKATMLEELNLSQNKLDKLDKGLFANNPVISTLDISNNHITFLDDGPILKSSSLLYLYIRNNNLTKLHKDAFSELPALVQLDLHYNRLQEIDVATFQTLGNLTGLNLANNSLTTLHVDTFKNNAALLYLILEGNRLVMPKDGAFLTVPGLIELDLTATGTKQLPAASLSGMPLLEHVILANNMIERLDLGAFDVLQNLKWVDLSGNSAVCRCGQPEISDWRQKRGIEVTAMCESPLGPQDVLAQNMCNSSVRDPLV